MASTEYDICVIGGGAAGLVVAAAAATLGAKVVLIENKTNQIVFLKEESETLVSCVYMREREKGG